jgi:hypothetical protein
VFDLSTIVDRLDETMGSKAETPLLNRITASINLDRSLDGITTLPAAFVIPGDESIGESPDVIWQPRIQVVEQVSIILVVRNVADSLGAAATAAMMTLSEEVKKALHGWRPEGRSALAFVGASPVGFDDQILVWSESFATRRALTPAST